MLPIMPLCGSSPSISTLSGCPQTPSSYAQVPVNFCLSASQTYSQGQTTYMWQPRGPEWSVKFPIASPCIWSLSVSSNSCLKTLIILNFLQNVWKLLQENSELEHFPEIFSHCFDPPRRKQPVDSTGHFGLSRSLSCFAPVWGFLFENNEFQTSLFSQLWQRQTPLLPQPMTSSSAPLSFWYTDHGISRINGPRLLCSLMLREWWCEATAPLPSEMSWEGFSLIFSNKGEKTPYSVKF